RGGDFRDSAAHCSSDRAWSGWHVDRGADTRRTGRALEEALMIGSLRGVSVWAHGEPCDMRKSFNTLQALVEGEMRGRAVDGRSPSLRGQESQASQGALL